MLQNAYLLSKIGADTAENEQQFAEILPIDRRWTSFHARSSEMATILYARSTILFWRFSAAVPGLKLTNPNALQVWSNAEVSFFRSNTYFRSNESWRCVNENGPKNTAWSKSYRNVVCESAKKVHQNMFEKTAKLIRHASQFFSKFALKTHQKNDEKLLNCCDWSGAKECTSCKSRNILMLKNKYLLFTCKDRRRYNRERAKSKSMK